MKPLNYLDFPIEVTELKADGTFRVRVSGQTPGGEMRADEAESPTYDPATFTKLLGKLNRRTAEPEEMYTLGEKLAALLLPGRVRTLYDKSLSVLTENQGLRLRLRIEPLPLTALPWEYIFVQRTAGERVPADFLALQRKISVTRYEVIGTPLKPLEGRDTIRIVAALANPETTNNLPSLELKADADAIAAAVALTKKEAGEVETVVLNPATRNSLLNSLPGADIFHFGGHGVFSSADLVEGAFRKKGQILLENEEGEADYYDSEQLAIALGNAGVRLAVLGACNTAERDEGGVWTGVAPALVRENVPAVVAMQYKVETHNAAHFISYLYIRVLGGYTIDEAVFEGRQALFMRACQENGGWAKDRDWGVPVLYLRVSDGILFPLPAVNSALSGSVTVNTQIKVREVSGELIGTEIDHILNNRQGEREINTRLEIDTITPDGKVIGTRVGSL